MSFISINQVSKTYQGRSENVLALEGIEFDASFGEFICLLGVSGCGKSTLLKILAGLEDPSSGTVSIEGAPHLGPHRDASVVFQEHGLFPWMTARNNIAFNLRRAECGLRSVSRSRIA